MKPAAPNLATPRVSVVIPIYNEEAILRAAVVNLRDGLLRNGVDFEILLAENGSRDATVSIARGLAADYPDVLWLSTPEPNYGAALRAGILAARGEFVICEEIDLCNVAFHVQALALLEGGADFVIGSKLIGGARDQRPLARHAASVMYTRTLQLLLGFPGTDSHGLKAFRRGRVLPIVKACVVDRDVFASELTIRAYRAGLDVREVPTRVAEMRPPSINLLRRVPNVVKNLLKLTWAIRGRG
jgi:glycosyltransferase involved in cell wall biosynthesis